jgi:hypothetical protein
VLAPARRMHARHELAWDHAGKTRPMRMACETLGALLSTSHSQCRHGLRLARAHSTAARGAARRVEADVKVQGRRPAARLRAVSACEVAPCRHVGRGRVHVVQPAAVVRVQRARQERSRLVAACVEVRVRVGVRPARSASRCSSACCDAEGQPVSPRALSNIYCLMRAGCEACMWWLCCLQDCWPWQLPWLLIRVGRGELACACPAR